MRHIPIFGKKVDRDFLVGLILYKKLEAEKRRTKRQEENYQSIKRQMEKMRPLVDMKKIMKIVH